MKYKNTVGGSAGSKQSSLSDFGPCYVSRGMSVTQDMNTHFQVCNICSAFNPSTIGTKVTNPLKFLGILKDALAQYDASKDRVPGQHFVVLPETVLEFVSAGVGHRTANVQDYNLREHRGIVSAFLKRELAEKATGCAVVLYTLEAYKNDPEVDMSEVANFHPETTHVVVAVLAFAGPRSPLSPGRFVSNLAGGNLEALTYSGDDIRRMAKEINDYQNQWATVAD